MKNFTVCLLIFCFLSFSCSAQNFLWGQSGGGNDTDTITWHQEAVTDMATDANGNVYILSLVFDGNLIVAGQPIRTFGAKDILIASYTPSGALRWTKVIGSAGSDIPGALRTDGKNGVYVSSTLTIAADSGHIDIDTVLSPSEKNIVLIKFDTTGNLLWLKMPQPNTVTAQASLNTKIVDMDVDSDGNIFWLCELAAGAYGDAGALVTISQPGDYILRFDADGNQKSVVNVNLQITGSSVDKAFLKYDQVNNRFYVSGTNDVLFGGVRMGSSWIINPMYVGCFDKNGALMWERHNTMLDNGIFNSGFGYRPVLDVNGNIYLCGHSRAAAGIYPNDTFNGYAITHGLAHGTAMITPFIVKIDPNGNNIWARDADATGLTFGSAVAILNNEEIVIAGANPDTLTWPGYSGGIFDSDGWEVFVTRFDALNGNVIGMDHIPGFINVMERPLSMVSDNNGNVYIGGSLSSNMEVNSLNHLTIDQGYSDWFLVKYGNMWPADVNSFVSDKDVLMYPNPAQNMVYIDKAGAGTSLQLNDMAGRNLATQILQSEHERIDVSSYPAGSYIIQLTDKNGGRITKKIVKG